jgi:hypothetical protein
MWNPYKKEWQLKKEVHMSSWRARIVTVFGMTVLMGLLTNGDRITFGQEQPTEQAKKCEVTSGANKGKTGTYTEGGTWCEGAWGGTECKDAQGNSKCKDVAKVAASHGVLGVVDGNAVQVVVTHGYYETPDHGLVSCTTSTPVDATMTATAVCLPVVVDSMEDLRESKDETNSRIADAVSKAIRNLPPVRYK